MKLIACTSVTLATILAISVVASAQQSPPAQLGGIRKMPKKIENPNVPLEIGKFAPDFTAFTANDKEVTLSKLKGKIVILDFWASWCGPCQKSMPGLEEIYQQIKNQDVIVLSLNTWDQKEDFQAWLSKNSGTKYHFNFVRDPAEGDHDTIRKESIAKKLYKVQGIPTMYVIDRDGKIAGSFLGTGNEAGLVKALDKLGVKAEVPNGIQ